MPKDLHIPKAWLVDKLGELACKHQTAIGVGAATVHESGGATEDYVYFNKQGREVGHHRKWALPAYDDVRANGAGQLWPEVSFEDRATPVEIPELNLKIGTIFCWEVFSNVLPAAYSMAGVNMIAHPIKFAPKGWPKLSKPADSPQRKVVAFAQEMKNEIWKDKLLAISRHVTMCPIFASCNTWDMGEKFMALTGHIDEIRGTTDLHEVPSVAKQSYVHEHEIIPAYYTGVDHRQPLGAFKAHVGSIDGVHDWGPWIMHAKIRRLEAQLLGGTTRLDCLLKASVAGRQKKSTFKRAEKQLGRNA